MIAILNTSKEALLLSSKIHSYLTKNRIDYNAKKWSELNKSFYENKWAVKIPSEYTDILGLTVVEKLPVKWHNEEQSI